MKSFRVTMFVELDGPTEADLQVKKSVQANRSQRSKNLGLVYRARPVMSSRRGAI